MCADDIHILENLQGGNLQRKHGDRPGHDNRVESLIGNTLELGLSRGHLVEAQSRLVHLIKNETFSFLEAVDSVVEAMRYRQPPGYDMTLAQQGVWFNVIGGALDHWRRGKVEAYSALGGSLASVLLELLVTVLPVEDGKTYEILTDENLAAAKSGRGIAESLARKSEIEYNLRRRFDAWSDENGIDIMFKRKAEAVITELGEQDAAKVKSECRHYDYINGITRPIQGPLKIVDARDYGKGKLPEINDIAQEEIERHFGTQLPAALHQTLQEFAEFEWDNQRLFIILVTVARAMGKMKYTDKDVAYNGLKKYMDDKWPAGKKWPSSGTVKRNTKKCSMLRDVDASLFVRHWHEVFVQLPQFQKYETDLWIWSTDATQQE